ncbi:MAG: hypothetical protein ABIK98_09050 [Pseudomonadota bacterium]|nr:hypothetical protein [Pseudomonadota bacterium]
MKFNKINENDRHFKSVLLAHFILVLHVLLITALIFLVIFFRGLINYMLWIFLGGSAAILASGYHFYKRMKREGKTLREMLRSPGLSGTTIEVSFLGGLASFKIGRAENPPLLMSNSAGQRLQQLEDPKTVRIRELTELVRLLETNMITLDEYNKVKQQIFKS